VQPQPFKIIKKKMGIEVDLPCESFEDVPPLPDPPPGPMLLDPPDIPTPEVECRRANVSGISSAIARSRAIKIFHIVNVAI